MRTLKQILPELLEVPPSQAGCRADGLPPQYDRCRKALANLPNSIDGRSGHNAILTACCEIIRWGIFGKPAMKLLNEFNKTKCFHSDEETPFPWSKTELRHKWESAIEKTYDEVGQRLHEHRPAENADEFDVIVEGVVRPTTATNEDSHSECKIKLPKSARPEAFDTSIGEYILATDAFTEANKHGRLIDLTTKVGNYFGSLAYVLIGSTRHYMNLYCALVGPTGLGRKGEAANTNELVTELLDGGEWQKTCVVTSFGSGEGIISRLSDPKDRSQKRVLKILGICEPDNAEESLMLADKRCMLESTELVNILIAATRESSTASGIIRQGWDGKPLESNTKDRQVRAVDYHLSLCGHITQKEAEKRLPDGEIFNGWANRFSWCPVMREKEINLFNISTAERQEINDLNRFYAELCASEVQQSRHWLLSLQPGDILTSGFGSVEFDFSQCGLNAMAAFSDQFNVFLATCPYDDLVARGVAIVARTALINAILHRSRVITGRHVASAIAAWHYCQDGARDVFAYFIDVKNDPHPRLVAWISEQGGMVLPSRITKYGPVKYRNEAARDEAISSLLTRGIGRWGEWQQNPKGGAKVRPFVLNTK